MLKVVIEKRKDFYFPLADKHFLGGEYQEPHRTNSLSFVDNFGVAMDIGAHVGTWAVDLVQKFDKVICFEPILEHRICLERNLEKFSKDKYEIHRAVLWAMRKELFNYLMQIKEIVALLLLWEMMVEIMPLILKH
jgi:hypothetical protein